MKLLFKVDDRFKHCTKEAVLTFVFLICYALFILCASYGLGGDSLSEYRFILGMPSWFFICVLGMLLFIVLLWILCFKIFADIPVEAYINNGRNEDA